MVNITIQPLKISVILLDHRYLERSASTSIATPACMGSPIKNDSRYIVNNPVRLDDDQRTKMPIDDPVLWFTNVHNQLKAPFVVYSNFENPDVDLKTKIYQEHVPCSLTKIASIDSNYDPEIVLIKVKMRQKDSLRHYNKRCQKILNNTSNIPNH